MNDLLIRYANDPKNPGLNFELAEYFRKVKHYAGACSYYLRCAEWADLESDTERSLVYESLMQISLCFRDLGNRQFSEEGWLLHAISLCPYRAEAKWLLAQLYERQKKWHECYMFCELALIDQREKTVSDIGCEGEYVIQFQKAVAAYWCGRLKESREIFLSLPDRYRLSEKYIEAVQFNYNSIGVGPRTFAMYTRDKLPQLKYRFPGVETIDRNYSQAFQDMFVLSALAGKRNGYYLEIGSSDPFHVNNTWLLESKFEWSGVSIDFNEKEVEKFKNSRKNLCVCRNARFINYAEFLAGVGAPYDIDYLQLDCEPPKTTYEILLNIPFDQYRFAVITFEHDHFVDASRKYRELSRLYLRSMGYELIVSDVSNDENSPFEDWYIHPELINPQIAQIMRSIEKTVTIPERYFLNSNENTLDACKGRERLE